MKSAITFFFCLTVFTAFSQGRFPELPVPSTPGEMVQAMEKLNTVGSVLYLAAHPDDENTRMISWLASERKVRTAYLSLTRGDGGQNLIGTEKGEELGLLRTQELLEARRVDGGEQFFTRAKDFGYSKNPEESFEIWGRQQILADVVWVIRKFRPDVIICRFPTTGEGGHGHHTASAILAGEAFKLAADPKAFPEQLAYVKTWQAKRVLWNSFSWTRKPNEIFAGEIKVETGNYNPLLGRNYGEIAAMARSKHRCQGFGSKLSRGEVQEYVKNIAGDSITTDILERVDLSWNRVEGGAAIGTLIQQAVLGFDLHKPAASVPQLLRIRSAIEALKDEHWKRVKLEEVDQLILACSGIYFEATSAATELTPGSKFEINIEGINRSAVPVVLKEILVNDNRDSVWNKSLDNNQLFTAKRTVTLPSSFPVSQPNWLAMKEEKGIYAPKDKLKVDAPENAPDLTITFVIDVSGVPLSIRQSIRHKEIDPSIGEIYQPLTVAPPVVFEIPKRTMMLVNKQDRQLKFAVKGLTDSTEVTVRLIAPAGLKTSWTEQRIKFGKSGEVKALEVTLSEKGRFESGELRFEVVTSTGTYSFGQSQVKYEHIRTQTWFPAANLKIRALEVSGNTGTIGYIPGPGDEVAECLQEIGFTVKKLSDQELQNADLGGYKAIICGIRTYNTNDRMALLQPALNRYIENGGTYIVQYQTNNFIGGTKSGIAPVKLTLGRERVTREEATVKILDPAQPLFTTPNAIGERDFQSWVQERGLYFASEWDASLKPVFEMNDPGEKVQQGSTLIGRYGQGEYIYSGLSFFRQLPAGVPGAYRLLVNMINLK